MTLLYRAFNNIEKQLLRIRAVFDLCIEVMSVGQPHEEKDKDEQQSNAVIEGMQYLQIKPGKHHQRTISRYSPMYLYINLQDLIFFLRSQIGRMATRDLFRR